MKPQSRVGVEPAPSSHSRGDLIGPETLAIWLFDRENGSEAGGGVSRFQALDFNGATGSGAVLHRDKTVRV